MKTVIASAMLLAVIPCGQLWAQDAALTAQDYIDIQQLNARYSVAIDRCTNGGYD